MYSNRQPQQQQKQQQNFNYNQPNEGLQYYDDENNQNYDDEQQANNEDEYNDAKQQQVWNRLQKSREESVKKKGGRGVANNNSSRSSGLPPSGPPKKTQSTNSDQPNYLEKNIEAIRNKEDLTRRYPEKKYEALYGRFYKNRVKSEWANFFRSKNFVYIMYTILYFTNSLEFFTLYN